MPKKSKVKVMKPMDENIPSYARNTPYKSVNEKQVMKTKDIFEQMGARANQRSPSANKSVKKKVAPKGFHYMPNGKLMKDSDMKKGSKY
tara:strand:- start:230 stop:496 length:267 start_codon:yes stop_codon:yes gene_type:complete